METAYAQALWKMVERGMEPKKAVHALHEQLTNTGRASLMRRILRAFERIAERELRKGQSTLTVAREHDERHAKTAVKEVLAEFEVESKDLKTLIDDTIIGGWRLEGNGRLIDASYKTQLLELYKRATSAV